jgi:hypothetical protein
VRKIAVLLFENWPFFLCEKLAFRCVKVSHRKERFFVKIVVTDRALGRYISTPRCDKHRPAMISFPTDYSPLVALSHLNFQSR